MEILFLCIKIFFVRILDVSMGTFRTILTVKGKTLFASLIGFIEVFIWFVIVQEALKTDETSIFIAISYALGFATGTFIGGKLSKKFISGNLSVQIITSKAQELSSALREHGYAVTVIDVEGKYNTQDKYMLFIGINNKNLGNLQKITKEIDPSAFVVINETKYVENGFMKGVIK